MLKFVLLVGVLGAASGKHVNIKGDYPDLKWPKKYNVEATKLYLTAGLVEEFKFWRSSKSSRLDANNGAVTKIARSKKFSPGIEYEIHPETTEEEMNKMVCYKKKGTLFNPVKPKDFLPQPDLFERRGEDNVKGVDCVKFTSSDEEEKEAKNTLWAKYENLTSTWVPVRYEEQTLDNWHGYLDEHMIWEFYNFEADVDLSVFEVEYDCTDKDDDDDESLTPVPESLSSSLSPEEHERLTHEFAKYKRRFNKHYAHETEHEMRKSIFYNNWRMVEERNSLNLGYKLALNKLSDRTEQEMKRYRGLRRNTPRKVGNIAFPYTEEKIKAIVDNLPSEYDLRLEGVVGPVLNQEDCGSCWSFGATAAVEGALARRNGGTLIKLSNQALIDCSWGFGNSACDGGTDDSAYQWTMEYGLPTEQEYGPYVMQEGFCNIENVTKTYKIRGFTDVTPFSVEALKVALVNHGPLSVSIHTSDAFVQYAGGIFYDPNCSSLPKDLNHEVTLVGYGEKDGETFWIIKNSWGPYWGLDGYVHMSARDNNCGVATEPTYVLI